MEPGPSPLAPLCSLVLFLMAGPSAAQPAWQLRSLPVPPGSPDLRMVFDQARGTTVLFDGATAQTWERRYQ